MRSRRLRRVSSHAVRGSTSLSSHRTHARPSNSPGRLIRTFSLSWSRQDLSPLQVGVHILLKLLASDPRLQSASVLPPAQRPPACPNHVMTPPSAAKAPSLPPERLLAAHLSGTLSNSLMTASLPSTRQKWTRPRPLSSVDSCRLARNDIRTSASCSIVSLVTMRSRPTYTMPRPSPCCSLSWMASTLLFSLMG